jgi:hypothetical protein
MIVTPSLSPSKHSIHTFEMRESPDNVREARFTLIWLYRSNFLPDVPISEINGKISRGMVFLIMILVMVGRICRKNFNEPR